jgi:hypothetical protein
MYVLARFKDQEQLVPAVRSIDACPAVRHWYAVDGHVHLVMQIDSGPELPEPVKAMEQSAKLSSAAVVDGGYPDNTLDPMLCHAWLFAECEPGSSGKLREEFLKVPGIGSCSETDGAFQLACIIAGPSFDALQETVEHWILSLDGVVRVKQNRIIDLIRL